MLGYAQRNRKSGDYLRSVIEVKGTLERVRSLKCEWVGWILRGEMTTDGQRRWKWTLRGLKNLEEDLKTVGIVLYPE